MTNFSDVRRLTILRCLHELDDRRANSAVLHASIRELGVPGTRDDCEAELQWLQSAECVVITMRGSIIIAELTALGEEVAKGERRVPGIARPRARG